MKKLICLIIAVIMLTALAACDVKKAAAAETPSAEIPPIEAPPEGISENFLTFSGQISRWDIAPFIAEFGIDEAVVRQSAPFSLAEDYNRQSLKLDELFADVASGNFKADEDYILSAAPDIAADAEPEMALPVEVVQDTPLAP